MQQCFPKQNSILGRYGGVMQFVVHLKNMTVKTVKRYIDDFQDEECKSDTLYRRKGAVNHQLPGGSKRTATEAAASWSFLYHLVYEEYLHE